MKKRSESPALSSPIVPLWMVTFSDTMGLLVCFFVMIIGFSATEQEDLSQAPGALTGYSGTNESERFDKDSLIPPSAPASQIHMSGYESAPEYEKLSYVRQEFDARVRVSAAANVLDHRLTENGFEIDIRAGGLFERDSARLIPAAEDVLKVIGEACRGLPHGVRVHAYADDLFIPNEEFNSAEDLAMRRSAALCSRLRKEAGIAPERLSLATDIYTADALRDWGRPQVTIIVLRPPRKRAS